MSSSIPHHPSSPRNHSYNLSSFQKLNSFNLLSIIDNPALFYTYIHSHSFHPNIFIASNLPFPHNTLLLPFYIINGFHCPYSFKLFTIIIMFYSLCNLIFYSSITNSSNFFFFIYIFSISFFIYIYSSNFSPAHRLQYILLRFFEFYSCFLHFLEKFFNFF